MRRTSARIARDPDKDAREESGCECGWWDSLTKGENCRPGCPTYIPPAPTEISGSVTVNNRAIRDQKPNTASYSSYSFAADVVPVPAIKLMGKDANRVRAIVISDAVIMIGKRDRVNARFDPAAIQGPLVLENQDELWAQGIASTAAEITVIQERWSEE